MRRRPSRPIGRTSASSGKQTVRDLWRQKDLGQFEGRFSAAVPRHGVVLVRLTPAP